MPDAKIKSVLAEEVDVRKAVMTIDLELIDSVAAIENEKKWVWCVTWVCLRHVLNVCM